MSHERLTQEISRQMNSLDPEEIRQINDLQREETEREYNKFKEQFPKGICSLCGSPLFTISATKPCLHWLVRECKFRKKDFELLYPTIGFFQMSTYLRWVANQEKFMRNINDLKEEKSCSKLFERTFRYKHLEWSFSCSHEDFDGHKQGRFSFPHYHFQMRISGQRFIDFGDYHIPFTKEDIIGLIMINKLEAIEDYGVGGVGLQAGISLSPEDIIKYSKPCDDDQATYTVSTVAMFESGITGEEIYEMVQESKRTGKTVASLMQTTSGRVISLVSTAESIPEIQKRKSR